MGEFVAQLRRRIEQEQQALAAARAEGDDYAAAVHAGELEELCHLADSHGVPVTLLETA